MAAGLGVLSGSTAQADTIEPSYTCGVIIPSYFTLTGGITWLGNNCTGPVGYFARGTVNGVPACQISTFSPNNGLVSLFTKPFCR